MRVRHFIPAILLLALVALLLVMLNLQYFNITQMAFNGNERYPDSILLKDTNLRTNENGFKQLFEQGGKLYRFRFSKEEEHLKKSFPYIKNISITYRLPDSIVYEIEERKPIFYTAYLGTFLVLDPEGTVLEVTDPAPEELILLSGISFTTFKIGRTLDLDDAGKLDSAYIAYNAIKKSDGKGNYNQEFLPLIQEISFADKKNMHMILDGNIVAIIPTDDNVLYNINSLLDIYFKNIRIKGNGVVDFTGSNPIFTPYNQAQKPGTAQSTTEG